MCWWDVKPYSINQPVPCVNDIAACYLSELCVPVTSTYYFRSSASQISLDEPTTNSQSSNHDLPAELRYCGAVSVEQSSGCSTENRDDTAHFQATTQVLSVPHLMCRRTEWTVTIARHYGDVLRDSGAGYKTDCRLTYLLIYLLPWLSVLFPCAAKRRHILGAHNRLKSPWSGVLAKMCALVKVLRGWQKSWECLAIFFW